MAVSICIPFYNAEEYLELAIKSVFTQTYTEWELILIDDGSTDNSLAIAKSIDDPRVKVYSDGKNKRLAGRLNELPELAQYEFLVRMDADDLMHTERIERQLKVFDNHPNTDLVATGCISITNDLTYLGSRGEAVDSISFDDLLSKKSAPLHASIIGRKSWFERNKYDQSLKIAQDYDLWLRSSKKNDFDCRIIYDRLYFYREENNATASKILAAYKNERKMFKNHAKGRYFKFWLKSIIKSVMVKGVSMLNKEDWLLKRRSERKIDPEEKKEYYDQIRSIESIVLPKIEN
ncbi:glycosyltransferase family 2 protein [Aquimarina sp. U1-2]|uniref:glycosyltransferase family 2 protein n=1 Tax=Aquimarina sp. U1-2 TaxID=2823141 RepID=UPI001AEC99EA|nr:glycosyltransferase family 2 protein [Aquimarina sp. U1-2]MBP2832015.1 glycosyltransferase family 2 protein [Aquimarina sp. U1-2]